MVKIEFIEGKKFINKRGRESALKDFIESDEEYKIIAYAFENVNTERELTEYLISEKDALTKTSMLLCIKVITNSSISESYEIFDKIYDD